MEWLRKDRVREFFSILGLAGKYIALVFNFSKQPSALVVPACISRPKRAKYSCKWITPTARSVWLVKRRALSSTKIIWRN
jgi:hypothetical protein